MQQASLLPEAARGLLALQHVAYTGEANARGLFARARIVRGTLVEASPCILIPAEEYQAHLRHTVLEHYLFRARDGSMLMCLGLGSMFNHSSRPNIDYRVGVNELIISFYAARDIEQGEELFIFYGSTLWFEDHASPAISIAAGSPVHNHVDDPAGFLRSFQLCSDPVLSTDNV